MQTNKFTRLPKEIKTIEGLIFGKKEVKPKDKPNVKLTYAKMLVNIDSDYNIAISINLTDINKLFKANSKLEIQDGDIIEVTGVMYNARKKDDKFDNFKFSDISKIKIVERRPVTVPASMTIEGE